MNNTINIENAKLIFRNFSGAESKINRAGNREFSVLIEDLDMADKLLADGWNLKPKKKRHEDDPDSYYLPVAARFDNYPPKVYLATKKSKKLLTEDTISMLDAADIKTSDVIISASRYDVNGKKGIKAYLKILYVVLEEDIFARKYAEEEFPEEDLPF